MATGSWIYDGLVKMAAYVVRLDYDFWFEIGKAEGDLEPGEEPHLGRGGRAGGGPGRMPGLNDEGP